MIFNKYYKQKINKLPINLKFLKLPYDYNYEHPETNAKIQVWKKNDF